MADYGEILRGARTAAGLSQVALAQKVGVSAPAIVQFEGGSRLPSADMGWELVAAILGALAGLKVQEILPPADETEDGRFKYEIIFSTNDDALPMVIEGKKVLTDKRVVRLWRPRFWTKEEQREMQADLLEAGIEALKGPPQAIREIAKAIERRSLP